MILKFNIHYHTLWGQKLQLAVFGQNDAVQSYEMRCDDLSVWNVEIQSDILNFNYQYQLIDQNGKMLPAYGGLRKFEVNSPKDTISITDIWRGPYGNVPFNSAVFSECFFKRPSVPIENASPDKNLIITLNCPQVNPERYVAITGNQPSLGNWDESRKVRLSESNYPLWKIALNSNEINFPLEYKYLIVDAVTDEIVKWEDGSNRVIEKVTADVLNIVNDEHFQQPTSDWKGAGVAIPVFSLRSKKSFGTGEFEDLKLMIDWAAETGQKLIQTLPINDTTLHHTNKDSYPYNAVSVYALHPLYLRPEKIGKLKDKNRAQYFHEKQQELNDKHFVDYQQVMAVKWEYFTEIYLQEGVSVFESEEYKTFFENNCNWLIPYAVFSYLRDKNGTPDFEVWKEFSTYNKNKVEEFASPEQPHYSDVALFYFLQFHLHKQLTEVHLYARSKGVALKGDVPIGVSPNSVDVWVDPHLFNRNMQAGAPPDDFSVTGQNWGFPTYNWAEMEKDDYQWWRNRFAKMAEYFDAYRIDHILGFFRIWEIPDTDVWGLKGTFHPSLPFSKEELLSRGVNWDEKRFLQPFMSRNVLSDLFGDLTDKVKEQFLNPDHSCSEYKFKPEFDTQKKIKRYFGNLQRELTNEDILIRDGLYMLHSEVLFVKDARMPDKYHPRISMHQSAVFQHLPADVRQVLEEIYVDYYYRRHTQFWKDHAYRKLPALVGSTNMLVCGEDLGMIPDSVPEVMQALEILSLEIQRMPKKPNMEFGMPSDAPYLSVCTTSTHDMTPVRAWWEEDAQLTQRFYNHALCQKGKAPEKCEQWIAEIIIMQHLHSEAMWVILPWQDWVAIEERLWLDNPFAERINVPSDTKNFWCYRMHIPLEKLLNDKKFNKKIRQFVSASGR